MNQADYNESQMHLDAMLYALDDPSLDRTEFEARLVEDERLGEILAEAVELLLNMRQSNLNTSVLFDMDGSSSVRTYAEGPKKSKSVSELPSSAFGLLAMAASILAVGFLGWKSFEIFVPRMDGHRDVATVVQTAPQVAGSMDAMKKVVRAWGEVGTWRQEDAMTNSVSFSDSEIVLASCDTYCECDVPEWLVLATQAVLDRDGGVDLPFEDVDSRTLIQ